MIAGNLKYVVLKMLSKKPLSGYGIMKQVKICTGSWKPSTGSVYPLLESMLKENLVEVTTLKRSKLYSLTEKGREELKTMSQNREKIINNLISALRLFSSISDRYDATVMADVVESLKQGEIPFKELQPEISELKSTLLKMLRDGAIGRNQKEIKKILRNTTSQLRSLQ